MQVLYPENGNPWEKFPVRVHLFVIRLADFKAKPVANQENAHPMKDWSCRICNQHRAHVTLRGTGFKPDTTRTDHARKNVADLRKYGRESVMRKVCA